MPATIDMEMLTSPHQATEAATMATALQVLSEAASEETMKDMTLPSATSMMDSAQAVAMDAAQGAAKGAAQAKTMALAEPQLVASATIG